MPDWAARSSSGAAGACNAAAGGADAASTVYFVNGGGSAYPTKWSDLTGASPPLFVLPPGVVVNPGKPDELDGTGWRLVMSGDGTTPPHFACREP